MHSVMLTLVADQQVRHGYTFARDAYDIAKRLNVRVWLRISDTYSIDIYPDRHFDGDVHRWGQSIDNHFSSGM